MACMPRNEERLRAVVPSRLVRLGRAPSSSKVPTVATCPCETANMSAVNPPAVSRAALTSPPRSTSSTSSSGGGGCRLSTASMMGVFAPTPPPPSPSRLLPRPGGGGSGDGAAPRAIVITASTASLTRQTPRDGQWRAAAITTVAQRLSSGRQHRSATCCTPKSVTQQHWDTSTGTGRSSGPSRPATPRRVTWPWQPHTHAHTPCTGRPTRARKHGITWNPLP
jgi:hypothetical protein